MEDKTLSKLVNNYILSERNRIMASEAIKSYRFSHTCTADEGWQYCVAEPGNACENCREAKHLYQWHRHQKLKMIQERNILSRYLRKHI